TRAGIILTDPSDPNFKCEAFSQAWVRSRASTSFTSEIKDIIAPAHVDIENCIDVELDNTAFASADDNARVSDTGSIIVSDDPVTLSSLSMIASSLSMTAASSMTAPPATPTATDMLSSALPSGPNDGHSVSPQVL